MQAAFLVEPGKIELREIPIPEPGKGEIIAKVHTALTCGTDLKTYRRGHPKVTLPSPFGHEFSGTVYDVGQDVNGFREGDNLMTVFSAPCGKCYFCKRGDEHICIELKNSLMFGAYAEYIRIPEPIVSKNLFSNLFCRSLHHIHTVHSAISYWNVCNCTSKQSICSTFSYLDYSDMAINSSWFCFSIFH